MGRFGFIIHPLSAREDVARRYPIALVMPERLIERMLLGMKPKLVSHITGIRSATGAKAEGWFGGCPLTARQIMSLDEKFVIRRIIEAGKVLQDAGARVIGLGAFTSVVGDAGVSVNEALECAVTTGNTYTVVTAVQGALEAARRMGYDPAQCTAAVVGAAGSIGRVCAQMLSEVVPRLLIVGLQTDRLEEVAADLPGKAEASIWRDLDAALPQADILVTVTSAVDAVIHPQHLKPGAVVCDVARPRDVSREVARARRDVLAIEGGVVSVPGDVEFGFDFGFPPKTSYACMAETIILALEERYEPFSLGRTLSLDKAREIGALAQKHGFKIAGFRSFERAVTDEQIETARTLAARARGD